MKINIYFIMFIILIAGVMGISNYPEASNPYNAVYVWHFDDGVGTTALDEINGLNFSWGGTYAWQAGFVGTGALQVTGDNSNIITATENRLNTGVVSISMWVNMEELTENKIIAKFQSANAKAFQIAISASTPNYMYGWVSDDGTSTGDQGEWNQEAFTANAWYYLTFLLDPANSNCSMYVNGTFSSNWGCGTASTIYAGTDYLQMFYDGVRYQDGYIDEVLIFTDLLTQEEINSLYTGTYASLPAWEPPTPPDASINNTNILLNASCSSGNIDIYFDQSNPPKTTVVNEMPGGWANYSTDINDSGTWYYSASCDNGATNATVRSVVFDFDFPQITLNPLNAFTISNLSTVDIYNNSFPINITLTEDRALYGFLINITHPNGTVMFNYTTTGLSGTTYNYTNLLNTQNWESGIQYLIEVATSDSHTKNTISDYIVNTAYKKIDFLTAEGNAISIESGGGAYITYEKLKDKYSFTFDFTDKEKKSRTFDIKSNSFIDYIEDSEYKGHFVIGGSAKGGNWLDFEGPEGTPIIEKVNDHYYKVTFLNMDGLVTFNSLGGLNVLDKFFVWVKGGAIASQSPNPALSGFTSVLTLNLSKNATITGANATLLYNNSFFEWTTKTQTDANIIFTYTVPGFEVTVDTGYPYTWIINYTQSDLKKFQTNFTGVHNIASWFVDDCTSGNTTTFYYETYDEDTGLPLATNITASLNYYITGQPTVTKNFQKILTQNTSFTFCQVPATAEFTGDITIITEAVGYGTRTFKRFGVPYEGTFKGYLVEDTGTTAYITFTLVDNSNTEITDALMTISRSINATDTVIFNGKSDFAGQVVVFLDQLYTYDFVINASGFPLKEFQLQPSSTSYTIRLQGEGDSFYPNNYRGLRFKLRYNGKDGLPALFPVSTEYQNISFVVEGTGLQEIGINFTNHNYQCIPASCSQVLTSTTGGTVTISILLNESGAFNSKYYFMRPGENKIFVNDDNPKVAPIIFNATDSLLDLMVQFKNNTSQNTRTITAGVIAVVSAGVGASLGASGYLVAIPVLLATAFVSLPITHNGVAINLIDPLIGMFMIVYLAGIIVVANMGR